MKLRINLRLTSLLLLLVGAVQFVSAYDFESGGVYYNITSETNMTAAVTYFNKTGNTYSGIVSIPASVEHGGDTYMVTAIGDYAFVGCTSLTGIKITERTTTIGNYVFSGCNGMTEFTIPKQITSIGNSAFSGCYGITKITIDESDETLGLGYNSSSSRGLFYDCQLQSVFIGRPLNYPTGYSNARSPFANIKTLKKAKLGNPVDYIYNYLFYDCTALEGMEYNSNCKPTAVGEYAFFGCKALTWDALALPLSVKTIKNNAFENCTGFTTIVIKPNITSIQNNAFNGCTSITGFPIEESDETLELGYNSSSSRGLFYDCQLQSVFIGRPLNYPTGYSNARSPFANIKTLKKAHLGNPVTRIQNYLFYGCSALEEMEYNSNFKPTAVGEYSFYGCKVLKNITIPSEVTSIEQYAFGNCSGLVELTSKAVVPPTCKNNAFDGIDKSTCKLIIPDGTLTDYQSAAQWKEFLFVEEKEFGDDAGKEQCATPTIAFADGKLAFVTATEDAECVWTLTRSGGNSGRGTTIEAPSVFELTVYATKEGWKNSDHATALLVWGDAEVEGDNVIRLGGAGGVNYDLNNDGFINTVDVVTLVNIIMNGGQ